MGILDIAGRVAAYHILLLLLSLAKAVEICLPVLEQIEKLINSYDYRRDAALRELEKRRDLLAKRARDFSNSMIADAKVTEVKATELTGSVQV